MQYLIESRQGVFMGVYEGDSEADALQKMYLVSGDDPQDARLQDWYIHEVVGTIGHKRGVIFVLDGGGCYVPPPGTVGGAGGGRYYQTLRGALDAVGLVEYGSRYIDIDAARMLMDDELVQQIHGTVDTQQEFFDAYCLAHERKHGKPFVFA